MVLVGRRSMARFCLLGIIYLGFGWVTVAPDVNVVLRLGVGSLAVWAVVEAVRFWCCVRRWRVDADQAFIPTSRNRTRTVPVSALADVTLFDGGIVRFANGLRLDERPEQTQLAINLFVSTRDFKKWLDYAKNA